MQSFRKIFLSGVIWKFILYLSSFLLNLAIAHYFGASVSGHFFYLLTNISLASVVLSFGIDSTINYFNSKKEFSFSYLLSTGILAAVFSAVLFFALFYFSIDLKFISASGKEVAYVVLYVFGILILGNVSALYYSSNNHALPNLIPAIFNFLLTALLFLSFSLRYSPSGEKLLAWYLISAATGALLLLFFAMKKARFKFSFDNLFNQKIISYTIQVFFANISFNFFKADIWLVNYFCTNFEMGNYIQTTKFSQLILLFPNLAAFSLFPLITQNVEKNEIETKILKLVNIYFYLGCIFCFLIIISGYWLFPFLYGNTFSKMYLTFVLYTPGILCLIASYPLTPFFSGINQNKIITTSAVYSIMIMLAADVLLIRRYSIYGAAIGSSLAYCFYFFRLYLFFKKFHPTQQKIFRFHEFYKNLTLLINR